MSGINNDSQIFIADIQALKIADNLERYINLLPCQEREKALRFRRTEDKLRSATGSLLIRACAGRFLGSSEIQIVRNEFGKPFIKDSPEFNFSLSHSGNLVVLAVAKNSVGVDVEEIRPIQWQDIACKFCEHERQLIFEAGNPLDCFYKIWTIREAFAKEEGIGLSIFDFDNDGSSIKICYGDNYIKYHSRTLYIHTLRLGSYRISVCSNTPEFPELNAVVSTSPLH